jgi:rare lipoprotein A
MRRGNARLGRWLVLLGALLLASCASTQPESAGSAMGPGVGHYKLGNPYQIAGRWYYPSYDPGYAEVGIASWYGHPFHGRATANGELFDRDRPSAAHPTLPLPSIVRVTNLANQRQLELRVNDRGPFVGDRIIDLSQAAARALGFEQHGITEVKVEFVRLADAHGVPPQPTAALIQTAAAPQPEVAPQPAVLATPPQVERTLPAARHQSAGAVRQVADQASDKRCLGFIQVGAFAEPERALRLAKELGAASALPVSADLAAADRYARVRLGPIGDPDEAALALRWLHRSGHANAFLVKPDDGSAVAC